jgi:hydroxyacylglutathione hydrolase
MAGLDIRPIPVLRDNYAYLIRDEAGGACAVVDPSVAAPVLKALDGLGWKLAFILNTHHHHDHVGGNLELKRATGCTIIAHAADADRIPGIDVRVSEGDVVRVGESQGQVIDVGGHTLGHIAFWFKGAGALFSGDTLFSLGCGRLFEGSPADMWRSLGKLRALPDTTKVYCGHEYTESNARFALAIDPDNVALQARAAEVRRLRAENRPTVPSTMESERAANPFLRADNERLQRALGTPPGDAIAAFAEIRRRKDVF